MHEDEELAKSQALVYLRRREHSAVELHTKLIKKGIDSECAHQVIAQLSTAKLQSDERFAENYSRFRFAKGFGPIRVQLELKSKGINSELAKECTNIDENQWRKIANQQLKKKFGCLQPTDIPQLIAMKQFLHQRGFPDYWLTLS